VALNGALERIADAGSAIAGMVENVRSMSRDTDRIKAHAAHLEAIDERLDRIVVLMERMVGSVEQLGETVEQLEESLEPVSRLAGRFPGRSKRNAERRAGG
jgi:methyl-accepting chemotaxis protein